MEILFDPTVWAGLLTLIVLEIVLGVDNLVFVAILAEKVPPAQRDKARVIGLSLALVMRLALLSLISWLSSLTAPLFTLFNHAFSSRDLILLVGGLFLLFKATVELHERLEYQGHSEQQDRHFSSLWVVVAQIVVLDAVFSLDSVITAVGIADHLLIMMLAVVIAMAIMLAASKPLTRFVNAHPTIVVLCLSFLLMIGLSLISEGIGFHIPKGYLYAAIGFSILIETFNQLAQRSVRQYQARLPFRERTAETILRLMGGRQPVADSEQENEPEAVSTETFADEERYMISGVLTLASRSLRSIMTPRNEISWVNAEASEAEIREQLLDTPHSLFPVCRGELDELIGVVRAKELLVALEQSVDVVEFAARTPALVVPETLDALKLLGVLREAKGSLVMVTDEFGSVQGLITPLDVLEAIAGEFPDEDETPEIVCEEENQCWLVRGGTDLHALQQMLGTQALLHPDEDYASLAGLLLAHYGKVPEVGDTIVIDQYRFTVLEISDYRIDLVRVERIQPPDEASEA